VSVGVSTVGSRNSQRPFLPKSTVDTTSKSAKCENFCLNEIFIRCQSFKCFNKTAHRPRKTADLLTMETGLCSFHALAAKQPRLKSSGPQSVVINAKGGSKTSTNCVYVSWQTNWISVLLIRQSGSGACVFVFVCMERQKVDILNTNWASSLECCCCL